MKALDRFGLVIFSLIILTISMIFCIIIFGWIDISILTNIEKALLTAKPAQNIMLGVCILLLLLAIKCIFFNGYSKEESKRKEGILLENENGKLLISSDTIENLANTVIKSFDSAESVTTKVDYSDIENISIYITLLVNQDVVIKELTAKLQVSVKEAIKKSLDIDIKEVNVRIKNVNPKREQIEVKEA